MTKIKYDLNLMKFITLFESVSQAKVKDALEDEGTLIFIVEENQIARAIGKQGSHVKRMEQMTKKRVKVVEFSNDMGEFIRNYVSPLEVGDIKNDDGTLTIYGKDSSSKSMIIGREKKKLELLKSIVGRYFEFKDIRVA